MPVSLGRMFGRTLLYYVTTSMLAIVTGLLMVNIIRPGLRKVPAPPRRLFETGGNHWEPCCSNNSRR